MRIKKAHAVDELAELLRDNGHTEIEPLEFELIFKQFLDRQGYDVRCYGVRSRETKVEESLKFTIQEIKNGTIKNLSIDPTTGKFLICPDEVEYEEGEDFTDADTRDENAMSEEELRRRLDVRRKNQSKGGLLTRFSEYVLDDANFEPKKKKNTQISRNNTQSRGKAKRRAERQDINLSTMFNYGLILVIVGRIVLAKYTGNTPTTQFWSSVIAIGTTKGMLVEGKDSPFLLKLFVIGIVWLAASHFI